jgi:hypothetical protein
MAQMPILGELPDSPPPHQMWLRLYIPHTSHLRHNHSYTCSDRHNDRGENRRMQLCVCNRYLTVLLALVNHLTKIMER